MVSTKQEQSCRMAQLQGPQIDDTLQKKRKFFELLIKNEGNGKINLAHLYAKITSVDIVTKK